MTDDATSATIDPNARTSSHGFTADVARLLQMMAHSVYSERDVFLRELVSNAADASEKLRYEALSNEALAAQAGAPLVALDKDKRLLTVADNGVGMGRDELVSALGTIANSGTRAFLDKVGGAENKDGLGQGLIGQFGVGFYSVFMVADKVEVTTRRAGSDEAWLWTSDGKGSYEIAPAALEDAPVVGTRVALHLNSDSDEFLEAYRVEHVLREHSGAIAIPIEIIGAPGEEPRRISPAGRQSSLYMRNQIGMMKLPRRQVNGQGQADTGQSLGPAPQLLCDRLHCFEAQADGKPCLLGQGQQIAETRHRTVCPPPVEHGLEALQFSILKTEDRLIPDLK